MINTPLKNIPIIFALTNSKIENKSTIHPPSLDVFPENHSIINNTKFSFLFISIEISDIEILFLRPGKNYEFILKNYNCYTIHNFFLLQMSIQFIHNKIIVELIFDNQSSNEKLQFSDDNIDTIYKSNIKTDLTNTIICRFTSHQSDDYWIDSQDNIIHKWFKKHKEWITDEHNVDIFFPFTKKIQIYGEINKKENIDILNEIEDQIKITIQ